MVSEGVKVGYARVSTDEQDLQAQRDALTALGVSEDRIYFDEGRSGKNRERPGLEKALAACWPGSTLVVAKLDRLGRSLRDLEDIAAELDQKQVALSIGSKVYDPTDPMDKMFFRMLGMFAEFERDLIVARTKEGMKVAKARGRLKGKKPKLSPAQQKQVRRLHEEGEHTPAEIGAMFGVSRQTVYRVVAVVPATRADR